MLVRILNPKFNLDAFAEIMDFLIKNARLIFEMTRDNLTSRYSGQFLGSLWIIIHPLALTFLYLFVFGVVFKQRIGGTTEMPLDYTAYILSGLIPWFTFQTAMNTAVVSIVSNAPLVKQFIFPLEVLPIREALSAVVIWLVGIAATLIYIGASQTTAMLTWLLLPITLFFQFLAMVGVAFLLSAVAVFFKDAKDIVGVFCLIAIFLMPIVYLPNMVPGVFRYILWANPFTYMVWVYQDIIYYGRMEHPIAWVIFFLGSLLIFVIGYRFFRKASSTFGGIL